MKNLNNIAVYLGSSGHCRPIFKQTAAKLGQLIAKKQKTLIYGGMDAGLMGVVANNVLAGNSKVIGIIPMGLEDNKRIHKNLSEKILVNSLWERKLEMFHHMDAAITLAGGYGTADELFEILYWAHLGAHTKPIVLVNTEKYYDDLTKFMDTLPDLPHKHLIIVETLEEAFLQLEKWNPLTIENTSNMFPHFEDEILQKTTKPYIIKNANVKDTYRLTTALGLKQLQRHERSIGILNTNGQYDLFLKWVKRAQKESFITKHCTQLYSVGKTDEELKEKLKHQPKIKIDLEHDKWGTSED